MLKKEKKKKKKDLLEVQKVLTFKLYKDYMKDQIAEKHGKAVSKFIKEAKPIDTFGHFKRQYINGKGKTMIKDTIGDQNEENRLKKIASFNAKLIEYAPMFLLSNKRMFEDAKDALEDHKSTKSDIDNYSKQTYEDYDFKYEEEQKEKEREMTDEEFTNFYKKTPKASKKKEVKPPEIDLSVIEKEQSIIETPKQIIQEKKKQHFHQKKRKLTN